MKSGFTQKIECGSLVSLRESFLVITTMNIVSEKLHFFFVAQLLFKKIQKRTNYFSTDLTLRFRFFVKDISENRFACLGSTNCKSLIL